MSKIILVTGGARSGKSSAALKLGESKKGPRAFVATCLATDPEMAERIRNHKKSRASDKWKTVEEDEDLKGAIARCSKYPVILVDCLTLWVYNLMTSAEKRGRPFGLKELEARCSGVMSVCAKHKGTIIFVTNELGLGIVPDNPLARKYRDLIGSMNQIIGKEAERIVFMVCGQPLNLKQ